MRESNFAEAELLDAYDKQPMVNLIEGQHAQRASLMPTSGPVLKNGMPQLTPFFSMRKLRLVFNQLADVAGFEYHNFEAFKHHVLSSVSPHIELSKWQSIASRR